MHCIRYPVLVSSNDKNKNFKKKSKTDSNKAKGVLEENEKENKVQEQLLLSDEYQDCTRQWNL